MKLTFLLLTTALLQVSATGYAQLITWSGHNVPVEKLFSVIRRQSGYTVVASRDVLEKARPVTLKVENVSIQTFLDLVLKNQPLKYVIENRSVFISPAPTTYNSNSSLAAPPIEVRGKVTDETGHPLPGVSVRVKNTSQGVSTDNDGSYTLRISAEGPQILIFSFVGMTPQEVAVAGSGTFNVTLKASVEQQTEVVVVGYGTQKRSDVTGAVSSVPKERLQNLPVTNVLQSIQGTTPGVNIISNSSKPGSSPAFYLRGLKSVNASNEPLIVLDGIPFSGSYNDINPNDIASIDLLKDVSASAIYGARGANGVIMITTKQGKTGKPQISYNGYAGPEYQSNVVKQMNGEQYRTKNHWYNIQAGRPDAPDLPYLSEQNNFANGAKEVNWLKEIAQQGYIHSHELSISGGSDNVKYYLSGTYLKEDGTLKGYQYNRSSIRANVDAKVTSWLRTGVNMFLVNNNNDGGEVSLFSANALSPYGTLYNAAGDYEVYPIAPQTLYTSPLINLYDPAISRSKNMTASGYAEIAPDFVKGLKYRVNASYSFRPNRSGDYTGRKMGDMQGTAQVINGEGKQWIVENLLTYTTQWKKHHLDLTALYSAQKDENFTSQLDANSFVNDNLDFYNMKAAQVQKTTTSYTGSMLLSQMFRINYNYDSRYLLTATIRRDGYSGFGPDNKYGVFPSVAVGWNIHNEKFMAQLPLISQLKLRASYGTSGNQAVGSYRTLSRLATTNYVFDGVTAVGVVPDILGNNKLKWETTSGLNLGIDFALWNNRLSGSIETYSTRTYDLLLSRKIPAANGYTSVYDNIGETANKGLEILLNTRNIQSDNFTWQTAFNISFNRNKVVSLYGDNKDDIGNNLFIGKPLLGIYDYTMVGIWQEGEDSKIDPGAKAGYIKFKDLDNSGKIDAADRSYLGTQLPKYIAGLTNTFTYKNFSLNIFLQDVHGSLRANNILDNRDQAGIINLPASIPYWTTENKINTNPALFYTNPKGYKYAQDASFIRVKDVTLSYNFNKQALQRYNISNLQVYVSGRNLATITKWQGYDPETSPSSITSSSTRLSNGQGAGQQSSDFYPLNMSLILGVNISL
ncbi:TonB-linked SusC/RagA family outer membrane protein [Chitinophaga polysaccharea]|uniref:TonB-linked SusC/RagA family outer membrane protein n=1 Tax=Chitinophaga polysaccharea TaxID=1293035 RepID=A0A561PTC7_9BACT|nr:TonB-dependent receptor [Chitinophaga polysaccharea]TWF41353.1 TonB-linked SusC/RagA family outer membrane protein [Chitinophaga polysaccharea]